MWTISSVRLAPWSRTRHMRPLVWHYTSPKVIHSCKLPILRLCICVSACTRLCSCSSRTHGSHQTCCGCGWSCRRLISPMWRTIQKMTVWRSALSSDRVATCCDSPQVEHCEHTTLYSAVAIVHGPAAGPFPTLPIGHKALCPISPRDFLT